MRTEDFNFALPPELIAQRPVSPRDAARLLLVEKTLQHRRVSDLPNLLSPGDLLVLNDTKVIPARLFGQRGLAKVEVTLHRALDDATWLAFAKPAKKFRLDDEIVFAAGLSARVMARGEAGEVTLRFSHRGDDLRWALEQAGAIPLPPYIRKGQADAQDSQDYQTLFAKRPGAIAAPTASLHFTPELMERLAARGIETVQVTLHVGAGTFMPVKVEDPRQHRLLTEWGEVSPAAAARMNAARARGGRLVAVGTTATRLVESAADEQGQLRAFAGEVGLFILPGYRFKAVERLLTNFHLPCSTLFMLVSAFAGVAPMRAAYAEAIAQRYRFYSYGDASLLTREDLV